jgi:hypothetical protein
MPGTLVTIGSSRAIAPEYRGHTGTVVGTTRGYILVRLSAVLTVGFHADELAVAA